MRDHCKVEGCDREWRTRGWCTNHYNQWRAAGGEKLPPIADKARFYQFVTPGAPDECWEWQGSINPRGYGRFRYQGKASYGAHRASYILHKGPIPDGLMVRHACDNPSCVNPNHLDVGTVLDNARDAVERDRYATGERNVRAKLTKREVLEILYRLSRGESRRAMREQYGVSKAQIQRIAAGRSWQKAIQS